MDPFHQQSPALVRSYPKDNYTLTIRPFCVSTDMDPVCSWLEQQLGIAFWKEDGLRPELLKSYIDALESSFSQSFFCLLDDRAVCQADISKALYNEIFMHLDAGSGDYALRLTMSPYVTVRNAFANIVKAHLEYFFSFEDVERVLTYLPASDEWTNHLLKNAGFDYLDTKRMLPGIVNLYECKKSRDHK
jgi:hypothetical protein